MYSWLEFSYFHLCFIQTTFHIPSILNFFCFILSHCMSIYEVVMYYLFKYNFSVTYFQPKSIRSCTLVSGWKLQNKSIVSFYLCDSIPINTCYDNWCIAHIIPTETIVSKYQVHLNLCDIFPQFSIASWPNIEFIQAECTRFFTKK